MLMLTISFQHCIGSPITKEKEIKGIQIGKVKVKVAQSCLIFLQPHGL